MEQRNRLLAEREQLKEEYNKWLKIQMDAYKKQNELLPVFDDAPEGMMAKLDSSAESFAEYEKAYKEEREASERVKETLAKISEINAELQS